MIAGMVSSLRSVRISQPFSVTTRYALVLSRQAAVLVLPSSRLHGADTVIPGVRAIGSRCYRRAKASKHTTCRHRLHHNAAPEVLHEATTNTVSAVFTQPRRNLRLRHAYF